MHGIRGSRTIPNQALDILLHCQHSTTNDSLDCTGNMRLASVDAIARSNALTSLVEEWGFANVVDGVRAVQSDLRQHQLNAASDLSLSEYATRVCTWLRENRHLGFQPVFNLTGTILHTNLGRAVLDKDLLLRAIETTTRPVNLEFDLRKGVRGDREGVVRERLIRLTGAQSATVVNNNAAAVLIVLNTFASNREVLVSRGELIEIGGSFRLPEIMSRAGCQLIEVGTTNRTRIADYVNAISEKSALLMKAHPSNFHIQGYTECATEKQLAELSQQTGIPFVLDLGSGALVDLEKLHLPKEPLPADSLSNGTDLVTFSGDKLMGGPQAGIIVGRADLIERIDSNPLKRALRMDKLSLALLDETLKAYEDPTTMHRHVKLLRDLTLSHKELQHRARSVDKVLKSIASTLTFEIVESHSVIGSGSQPTTRLPSLAVAVSHTQESELRTFEQLLRDLKPAVIGRRSKSRLLFDMRGAEPLDDLLETLGHLN